MPPRLIIVAAVIVLLLDGISSQIVEDAIIREAAAKLTDNFDKLKEQGLGIGELEVRKRRLARLIKWHK